METLHFSEQRPSHLSHLGDTFQYKTENALTFQWFNYVISPKEIPQRIRSYCVDLEKNVTRNKRTYFWN